MEIVEKHGNRTAIWARIMEIDSLIQEGIQNHKAILGDTEGTAMLVEAKISRLTLLVICN